MSAIFGIFNGDGPEVEAPLLASMSGSLSAYGEANGDGFRLGGSCGLGARVQPFTPEDLFEAQPLLCPQSGRFLVADARLHERPELAQKLGISPLEAAALPDSALILRAFEKWGATCATHLRGEWAFAVWDAPQGRLVIACDHLGTRGLLWHRSGNRIAFCTAARGLFALPHISRQLDEETLADYLVGGTTREKNETQIPTFYRDIWMLPPAHCLIASRDGMEIRPYWTPDTGRKIRLARDEDYVEGFVELFERAVKECLRSLSPVGVMMSGGLDSASIGATAARLLAARNQRVTAFTEVPRQGFEGGVFQGRYADETPYVQAVAALYPNLDVEWVRQGDKNLLDDAQGFLDHGDGPFGTAANRVWWEMILREAGARGINTILDGMQGNVAFSWSGGGLLAELIRGGKWKRALHEARLATTSGAQKAAWRALIRGGIVPLLPEPLRMRFVGWRYSKAQANWEGLRPLVRPEFEGRHDMSGRVKVAGDALARVAGVQTSEIRWGYFQGGVGGGNSAFRARFGVDARRPLCDLSLVEWCLAIPEEQCCREGQPRFLVRRAMADRLPGEVIENQKRGLQAADWLEHLVAARGAIEEELAFQEKSATVGQILDTAPLRRLVDEWPSKLRSEDWAVLNRYRMTLSHGLMLGRFLRSFD